MYIEINNLHFRYNPHQDYIIKNFSLSASRGTILAILGESGSGKSTVLRLLSGLEVPEQGEIKINGKVVADQHTFVPPEERNIGMVFQDYALFPHMTVAKNICFGLKHMDRAKKNRRSQEVLALVDLQGFEHRYPHELSGGQQQRVALARALAPQPDVLLLDEPFSNLDAMLQARIRDELKEILTRAGITAILVTHDQEDARRVADQVVVMEHGEIKQIVNPQELR